MAALASDRRPLWLGLILFLVLVAAGWVGFLGSDDVTYARGAYGWIEQFPFVGGHGTIRYPLTVPMAASFLALGGNELALTLPSLLYAVGMLAVLWWWVRHAVDEAAALAALLALVTMPLLVIITSIANVEMVEAFFLFLSVTLFWRCLDEGPRRGLLLLSGAAAGLAFLTRETAIFVVPFYAMLFLAGHRFSRWHYLWIIAGFLIVWVLELLYLGLMTGDPLYRINISLHHDSSINRQIDLAGNIIVHPLLDPLIVLFVNQEFMLLFFLAVPLGAWLCFGRQVDVRTRHFARIVALLGLTWFLCAASAQSLLPLNPRYFIITSLCAALLTGVGLARLAQSGRRRAALLAGAALLAANAVGIAVENKDLRFGERTLAHIAEARPELTIVTDPMTRYRADLLLRWNGTAPRTPGRPPRAGELFLHNPAHVDQPNAKITAGEILLYRPQSGWKPVARFEPGPSYLARSIEALRLDRFMPAGLWTKVRVRHAPVTLYRVA